ncbi:DEAD/DEAH box helicase family protein [Thermoanaerobacterium butyriciformans]|uniref:Type III restriction enzyme n=1 Tax=Thermoanaerobacterium butyriciformans TaxID=1702242 RepID=A0ABS4NAS9_9THEO|nr:DEAD/DEAH box helicase family protein [Thermoanaerobacterium butyriciformans]MBP2070730.1 type III restriction enzyme [Thermoanaerobacterium butyriciformans]
MEEVKIYKTKDLVLRVNSFYDPSKLNLDEWEGFLDVLCGDREYQKEAIKNAIIYLAGGRYTKIEDLIEENYNKNPELKNRYVTIEEYKKHIQLSNKLSANIDLATGTGKSYVIYGIAQIMLGLGLVDKVLVLAPSLTIKTGLTEKFKSLSGNSKLKKTIPKNAKYKNSGIVNANVTVKNGDICIENIHAVYERTGSSIEDSFKGIGERVLVLNDEAHHIYNKVSGRDEEAKSIKKWKEFLLDPDYNFKYILGFTGTAYIENEYFNDVIYRYSLREAIEDKIVKNIEYVQEDDSLNRNNENEKFQKIYQNHQENKDKYPIIKPLTILVTKDISSAKNLREDLINFLIEKEQLSREEIEKKVLIATSANEHKANIPKLKTVDNKNDSIEWIVSVSMLTEGWDVKNVFQIVPWEDRAFNSKLLIAQVLGRGLRIPIEYQSPQPRVVVFNHDAWSKNIKGLVYEILEIETKIYSEAILGGERSKYHFEVYNLDYSKEEVEIEHKRDKEIYNYSRIEEEGIKLESQVEIVNKETVYESVSENITRKRNYAIEYNTWSVEEVLDKIYEEFQTREWEGRVLQLGENQYTKNNLPPRDRIKEIIIKSMRKVGIKGDKLVEKNVNKIFQSFSTLLRKKGKTVTTEFKIKEPIQISTKDIQRESISIGSLKRDYSIFYTNNWKNEIKNIEQKELFSQLLEDETLPKYALKEQNEFLFKTPVNLVFTNKEPERKFVEQLCKKEVAEKILGWIKSRDRSFYSIEYTWRKGGHQKPNSTFNPDFFIKIEKNDYKYFIVVEIKSDGDDSEENKAKYKYAKEHFERLNSLLQEKGIKQKYIFHFLSPKSYPEFFEYLKDSRLIEEKFKSEIENLLENEG